MNGKQNLILFIGLLLIFLNLWWGGQWSEIWAVLTNNIPASGSTEPNYGYGQNTNPGPLPSNPVPPNAGAPPGGSNEVPPIQPLGPLPMFGGVAL